MKVIVITGATAGIGAKAVEYIASEPNTLIIAGARGSGRNLPEEVELYPLDLSVLKSVRFFADEVKRRLGGQPIDILILNAGAHFGGNHQKSADGIELTFATNHLSHYLLARLLWDNMAVNGRIVITTSDLHDPNIASYGPTTLQPIELAYPVDPGAERRLYSYAAAKLCNILTARSFAEMGMQDERKIEVIAYNPGATLGTNFAGKPSVFVLLLTKLVLYPILFLIRSLKIPFFMGTAERSGHALADLALGIVRVPKGKIYASLVNHKITFPDPSSLAMNNDAKDLLWKESAKMVGSTENS